MIKVLNLFFLLLLAINCNELMAQANFVSQNLSDIYSKLPLECKNKLTRNGEVILCSLGQETIPVKIQHNTSGEVVHLGIALFNFEDNLVYPSALLALIERFSLWLFITNDLAKINKSNTENKISLRINHKSIQSIDNTNISTIKEFFSNKNPKTDVQFNSKFFLVTISHNQNNLEILFPANYELVSGLDKSEYGLQIQQRLISMVSQSPTSKIIKKQEELIESINRLYVDKKPEYFKNISGDTYFSCQNLNMCTPVRDKNNIFESMQNNFLLPISSDQIKIQITQKLYGNKQLDYVISLRNFIEFFLVDHNLYFGFESNDKEKIIGTLIISHQKLNYINLLHVTFKSSEFFSEKGTIVKGKFYTNIPNDNIKNIFGEFR
jgi:hypothetical protein